MNKLSSTMVDSIIWNNYEYPREFYGEDSPYNYVQPPPSCQQISQDVNAERDERRRRAIKRVQLRSDCHIWEQCCEEVAIERMELDHVLLSFGFPGSRHSKDKSYPERMYSTPPDINSCSARDYLEYYIFPYVLSAITELIKFTQNHSILSCKVCTFAASDFISEYLYNHNPLHPRRQHKPMPIYETEMAKRCLKENPRPPLPKWLKMSKDDAAVIIQRAFRGFLVRRMENVQEMRQFWRDYKSDNENTDCDTPADELRELLAKYDQEDTAIHAHDMNARQASKTHSQECDLCATFRKFIQRSKGRRKTRAKFALSKQRDSEKNKLCYQDAAQANLIAIPATYKRHKGHPSLSCLVRAKCPTERTDSEIDLDVACAEFRGVPSMSTIQSSVDLPAKHLDKNAPNNSQSGGSKATATDSTIADKVRVKGKKAKAK